MKAIKSDSDSDSIAAPGVTHPSDATVYTGLFQGEVELSE